MRPLALRVGLFALAGSVLLALAIAAVGGQWFAADERGLMRFDRSVYGLQPGAPVVLRGVRVGQVVAVGLAPAAPGAALAMPVTASFDRALLRSLLGPGGGPAAAGASGDGAALPQLVQRGLVARMATQSLLTGLLYIDLDLDPARAAAAAAVATAPAPGGALPLIPTEASRLQAMQAQLEGLDLARIGPDLAAVAASARQLLAGPDAARLLGQGADAAQQLQGLAAQLGRDLPPLLQGAQATLADTRRSLAALAPLPGQLGAAAGQVAGAASQVGGAAQQVGAAAAQAQALAAAGQPMVAEVQRMSAQLGQAAAVLREAAAEDSALRLNADRALQDVARAARALRELGELLERHPDALLRGRADVAP